MQVSTLFASDLAGACDAARAAWRLPANEPSGLVRDGAQSTGRRGSARRSCAANGVYLLIVNAPNECVIGGQRGEVEDIIITLGCEAVELTGASTVALL